MGPLAENIAFVYLPPHHLTLEGNLMVFGDRSDVIW